MPGQASSWLCASFRSQYADAPMRTSAPERQIGFDGAAGRWPAKPGSARFHALEHGVERDAQTYRRQFHRRLIAHVEQVPQAVIAQAIGLHAPRVRVDQHLRAKRFDAPVDREFLEYLAAPELIAAGLRFFPRQLFVERPSLQRHAHIGGPCRDHQALAAFPPCTANAHRRPPCQGSISTALRNQGGL